MPSRSNSSERNAYIITGPTSGIGFRTALGLAKHGTVVLVGRDPVKLAKVQKTIEQRGGRAMSTNTIERPVIPRLKYYNGAHVAS
jgi:short-subunit dehydrogenase